MKEFEGKLIFKGGTCLSKAYNVIKRFSEDIDITIDKSCVDQYLSLYGTSKKKGEEAKRIRKATHHLIKEKILPLLRSTFSNELAGEQWGIEFKVDDKQNGALIFNFPIIQDRQPPLVPALAPTSNYNYIKPSIKLEIGARGDTFPCEDKYVMPYLSKVLDESKIKSTKVKVLDVKRNFLEKLLILHSVFMRPLDRKIEPYYSRHYYDIYILIKAGVGEQAIKYPEILEAVVKNKSLFWPESWMNYGEIKNFKDIKFALQEEEKIKKMKEDYELMKVMFFEDYPNFDEILKELAIFQNSLKRI